MVGPSLNTHNLSLKPNAAAVKFLCSYGGKILPRYPDGMLRYHGGQTRVLAVDRSISFSGDEPDLSISQDGSKKEGPEESGDYHWHFIRSFDSCKGKKSCTEEWLLYFRRSRKQ